MIAKHLLLPIWLLGIFLGRTQSASGDLSRSEKEVTVRSVGDIIAKNYVFPKVAAEIDKILGEKFEKGDYDTLADPQEFARILTVDVQSVNHDLHLRVLYEPERIAEQQAALSAEDSLRLQEKYHARQRKGNYGFRELKILDGNVGYLDLRGFGDPGIAAGTAIAAMNFLSNADAVIIDLRNNGGGSPAMVQLLSSYFFEKEPIHLNSFYKRGEDQIKQFWTLPYVPGPRRPFVPLYILTSSRTFSAAEEFCYNMKHLKRAVLVGETTGGGAHPGGRIQATEKFNVWTPTARAINPVTHTNWEGTGVTPHITTKAEEALSLAHKTAMDSLGIRPSDP